MCPHTQLLCPCATGDKQGKNSGSCGPEKLRSAVPASQPGVPAQHAHAPLFAFLLGEKRTWCICPSMTGWTGHACVNKAQLPGRPAHTGSFDLISYSGWKCLALRKKGFHFLREGGGGGSFWFLFICVFLSEQGGTESTLRYLQDEWVLLCPNPTFPLPSTWECPVMSIE